MKNKDRPGVKLFLLSVLTMLLVMLPMAAWGAVTVSTSGDTDNVYFHGNSLSVTISGFDSIAVPNGTQVRVAFGYVDSGNVFTSVPIVSGLTLDGYHYMQAAVSGTSIALPGLTVNNPGNNTYQGVIAVKLYIEQGPGNWQAVGAEIPLQDVTARPALVGASIPAGDVSASPGLETIANLYSTEQAIAFSATDPSGFTGSIQFPAGLNIIDNRSQLQSLQGSITLLGAINVMTGEITYQAGIDTGVLTFLSSRGASVSMSGAALAGLQASNFSIINPDDPTAMASNMSMSGNTLSFDVNHFSTYNITGGQPQLTWGGGAFSEAAANNGSIDTVINLTLVGDTFTGANDADYAPGNQYSVANVPAGLTVKLTKKSSATAEVRLTGNAAGHAAANSIANLAVTLTNAAFTGGNAGAVTNSSKADLAVSFNDPGAPTVTGAATNPAGTVVTVTFSKVMADPAGKHGQFTVLLNGTGDAVMAAALNADTTKIDLTLTTPAASGDTVTVAYTAGTVAAADGGALATFGGQAVTNNVPAPPTFASAATNTAGTVITVTFSKAMADPTGKHGQFTVLLNGSGDVVTAAALNADTSKIDLTLTTPIENGNTVTVAYTAGDVAADDSGALASFGPQAVTNSVTARPTFVSAATNPAGTRVTVTFSKAMADPAGQQGQFAVLVNGTGDAVTAAVLNATNTKIDLTLTTPAANGDTVTVAYTSGSVAAADGGALASFAAQSVTNSVPVPITTGEVTVAGDGSNKQLSVSGATPESTISVPGTVTDAAVNVETLLNAPVGGTVTSNDLPKLTIKATTSISATPVEVAIPAGAKVSADASNNWDGTINVPTVKANNSVAVNADPGRTAAVNAVIEVGFGDVPLTFSKAVRILVPGQAGKDAGYYRGGTFTKITVVCTEDSQAWADANLPAGGDGRIDVGSDLVIWTKHFTRFIAYTQTVAGGGGGGGGGTAPSEGTRVTSFGGTVTGNGATIFFPAGALSADTSVIVKKVANNVSLPVSSGSRLISDVLEITRDRTGKFARPVTLTLGFNKSGIDPSRQNLSLCWLDESVGKWVDLGNVKVDLEAGKVSGVVDHFTKFAVLASEKQVDPVVEKPGVSLKDIAGHWSETSVKTLVGSGAISGYPDGTFRPDSRITRAEFAAVLVKAFSLQPKAAGRVFGDTAGHWAREAIAAAEAQGIVSGYSESVFGPDDPITREQMALMIARAAKLAPAENLPLFRDGADISGWAAESVAAAVNKGVIKGYPDNAFLPGGSATRAEAAAAVINALK